MQYGKSYRPKGLLSSLIVHLVALLVLRAVKYSDSLPDPSNILLIEFDTAADAPLLESLTFFEPLETPKLEGSMPLSEVLPAQESLPLLSSLVNVDALSDPDVNSLPEDVDAKLMDFIFQDDGLLSPINQPLSKALESRQPNNKAAMLRKYGGSKQSEAAVELALDWLVQHQAPDGGWTFGHDRVCNGQCGNPGSFVSSRNAATGLALLPFLGAGHTHVEGKYKDVVQHGIAYLRDHQRKTKGSSPGGSWREEGGTMYSHCLASIAICEAHAMTDDSQLRDSAQLSLNYLVQTQDIRGGGWRYAPGQPGDTSVVGWAVMALKSGRMGGLEVPQPTLIGVDRFLNSVRSRRSSKYGYVDRNLLLDGGRSTTAIGLLCRMYQGVPQYNSSLIKGVNQLAREGPRLQNLYYTYHAAQVMRHLGGTRWVNWNQAMRDPLIKLQVKSGHAAGSWRPNSFPEMGGPTGGRLYSTCAGAMILEVYYRHMPLYSKQALDEDFKL